MTNSCTVFVLHMSGASSLGVERDDEDGQAAVLHRLRTTTDPVEVSRILNFEMPGVQNRGDAAPLAAALATLSAKPTASLHLVMLSTCRVRDISEAIERALQIAPHAYGRPFDHVETIEFQDITEEVVRRRTDEYLREKVRPKRDRVVLVWGAGSTQIALGALDAVVSYEASWQMIHVDRRAAGLPVTFEPVKGLPVDPVVPLLRRWRYHDLLVKLSRDDVLRLSPEQQRLIEAEAAQWGRAYADPTPARLRATMAAALLRGDASSGFAVRAYITHRYRELLASDELDLLSWAEQPRRRGKKQHRHPTLGTMLKIIREEQDDDRVVAARRSVAGQFLDSTDVDVLNEMGKNASHELIGPTPKHLRVLRQHLLEFESSDHPLSGEYGNTVPGFSRLSLVPSTRVWYFGVLPPPRREDDVPAISQAVTKAVSPSAGSDRPVRDYLGATDGDPLQVGLLVFGTKSSTALLAAALAEEWRRDDLPAVAVTIDDVGDQPIDQRAREFELTLREHIGQSDVAALVLVPSGPKEHVMALLIAAQRVAAEWGVPLYLRQLVDERRDVGNADYHRLPLRFGAGVALSSAALHAFDCGEWDTVARLLGAASESRELAGRAMALSHLIRCDFRHRDTWPKEFDGFSLDDLSLIGDRIDVWASVANLSDDVSTQIRAIIGACAAIEVSITRFRWRGPGSPDEKTRRVIDREKDQVKATVLQLFQVRNKLPVTHGAGLRSDHTVDDLVRTVTEGRFTSVTSLLTAMAERIRERWHPSVVARPRMVELAAGIRDELLRRYEAERRRSTANAST